MKKLTTLLFILISINSYIKAGTTGTIDQKKAEKEAVRLKTAVAPEDSIKILYDVYDLSDRSKKYNVGYEILEIADRTGNRDVTLDILSRLASHTEDTEALGKLLEVSSRLPDDSARKAIEVIIGMESAKSKAGTDNPEERRKKLLEYARADLLEKTDIYEEILNLYRAMVYLGMSSQGSLYLEYITRLQDLVKQLPEKDFAIRNLVFSTAAIYYTRKQDYDKALESSNQLLNQIELLKKYFPPEQRQFQTFDYFRYMVNRRMLENYRGMSQEEARKLYEECVEIASQNAEVDSIFSNDALIKSFYNMSQKNYKEAVPYLKQALNRDSISNFRKIELGGFLVEAYENIGDKNGLFDAMQNYISDINEQMRKRSSDAYNELALRTDINRMDYQEKQELAEVRERHNRMRKVSITLVYVLGIALIFLIGAYFKLQKKTRDLARQNRGLHHNIQNMFDDGTPIGTHDARLHRGHLKG